ncbi:hypothetical protein LWI28_027485 [Acer negundo]|uniref:Transcription repressor n=1 Tax=Acer negundo TaxID=4023 RepID=A0AAD5P3D4_ACENE|nr:hypothetical protein LWI28_027485 [Acer negundo]KAK4857232.1 hypothetical protein QYF36_025945 [Acer negundo]
MSTNNKKNLLKSICTANVGCGCGRTNLSDVYEPKPKPKNTSTISNSTPQNSPNNSPCCFSSSTSNEKSYTSTRIFSFNTSTQSSESETDSNPSKALSLCSKIFESIAVVKDSNDPYQDFRRSMMQMIMEKEIYSKEELQELLKCFLELNSPLHHDVIVQAFTEIWNNEAAISRKLELHPQKPC